MKTTFSKLAVVSFAAMLLASCSDSNNGNPTQAMNTSIVGSEVVSQTDAQALASRVENFKSKVAKSRVIDENNKAYFDGIISMPEEPTIPDGAYDWSKGNTDQTHDAYFIPKNHTANSLPWNNGNPTTVYVQGKLDMPNGMWQTNLTLVILSDGELITNNKQLGLKALYNYGKITYGGSENWMVHDYAFYQKNDLILPDNIGLTVNNKCYIGGNLKAAKLTGNTGLALNIKGNCDLGNSFFKFNGGKMNCDGIITAGSFEMNNGAKLYNGCGMHIKGDVNLSGNKYDGGAELHVGYLKCENITQAEGSNIVLKSQSFIDCNDTYFNHNNDAAGSLLEGNDAVAVIKASKIKWNSGAPVFETNEDGSINYKKIKGYEIDAFKTPGTNSKILFDGEFFAANEQDPITPFFLDQDCYTQYDKDNIKDIIIKKSECNGNKGYNDTDKPSTPDEPKPTEPALQVISKIDYDHTHDISATCIQPYNGKMYMSYHTRGRGHGACIEVFDPVNANEEVKLDQYFYDKAGTLDFNHLMVDQQQKRVYVVGSSSKKGAMMAYVDLKDDGLLNSEPKNITVDGGETKTYEPLNILPLQKATAEFSNWDENCIDKDDAASRYVVMTTKGYTTYDVNSLNKLETIDKPGKAKHVDIEDGKIATLYLEKEATTTDEAINARVEVFSKGGNLNEPTSAFEVGEIQPNNGKNVLSLKNNKIYVCRGVAGIYCYDMQGNEQWHYQMPNPINEKGEYKAYANGCYVANDGLVYVAYGSYGLVVLDTNTISNGAPKVVAQRNIGHSANYVTVYNDYIYVANGRSRLGVFHLINYNK